MQRTPCVCACGLYLLLLVFLAVKQVDATSGRPNILLLFPDQWRYDWDSLTNSSIPLHLPTFGRLASGGVRFTQAYVPAPLCAPSRAALALGRDYDHTEVPDNTRDTPFTKMTTFYALLKSAGYHTMTAGRDDLTKHSGVWKHTPNAMGFANVSRCDGKMGVIRSDHAKDPYGQWLQRHNVTTESGHTTDAFQAHKACVNRETRKRYLCDKSTYTQEFYQDDWITREAINLLHRRPRDRPFFIQVNFAGPHPPLAVTRQMRMNVSNGRVWPEPVVVAGEPLMLFPSRGGTCNPTSGPSLAFQRCNYAAMLEHLDDLFQLVLREVDMQGVLANTLVIVSSDHGEMLGDHGVRGKERPQQASVAVPLVMAGPGLEKGKLVTSPVSTLDLVGTILDFAGVKPAQSMHTVSMRCLMTAGGDLGYRDFIRSGLDYRDTSWRLVVKDVKGTSYKYVCCKGRCPVPPLNALRVSKSGWMHFLIDTIADPFDLQDLSQTRPDIVAALLPLLPRQSYSGDFVEGCGTLSVEQPVILP